MKAVRCQETLKDPLLAPLWDDLVECDELLDRSDSAFARRTYVRASFAFIEGHFYQLRDHARRLLLREWSTTGQVRVSHLSFLQDETYRLEPTGKLKSEKAKWPTKSHMAFVMRTIAECSKADPESLFSDSGWEAMQKALWIRDRITHPKSPADLEVSDDDISAVRTAHCWVFNSLIHSAKGAGTS